MQEAHVLSPTAQPAQLDPREGATPLPMDTTPAVKEDVGIVEVGLHPCQTYTLVFTLVHRQRGCCKRWWSVLLGCVMLRKRSKKLIMRWT